MKKTTIMKLSELIKKLQILEKKHGNNNLTFSVSDSYSVGVGEPMSLNLEVGEDERGFNWSGCNTVDDYTNINFDLNGEQEKSSKITYRKR